MSGKLFKIVPMLRLYKKRKDGSIETEYCHLSYAKKLGLGYEKFKEMEEITFDEVDDI